jgi:hypothetical protein
MTVPLNDMPVFTIKAKDAFAIPMLKKYHAMCLEFGLYDQADEVTTALKEMWAWREENKDLVKLPDHKHVSVDESV